MKYTVTNEFDVLDYSAKINRVNASVIDWVTKCNDFKTLAEDAARLIEYAQAIKDYADSHK